MSNTGWVSPGTVVSNTDFGTIPGDVGTIPWNDPSYAATDDSSYAYASVYSSTSHYLKATNFGFAIPAGATINGILVEIKGRILYYAGSGEHNTGCRLVGSNGTFTGNTINESAEWTGTTEYRGYGGDSNLWGTTWTANDINDTDFGVGFWCQQTGTLDVYTHVFYIRIKVYYTESSTPTVGVKYPLPAFKRS